MKRLIALLLLIAAALWTPALTAQDSGSRTSPFADGGDIMDWDHWFGRDPKITVNYLSKITLPSLPTQPEIDAAATAWLAELQRPQQFYLPVPMPDGTYSQPDENTPNIRNAVAWSAIYAMHRPDAEGSDAVLLLVNSQKIVSGPRTEPYTEEYPNLKYYQLYRDAETGQWRFSLKSHHYGMIGFIDAASQDELLRQFTASMQREGFVPGLSDGSGKEGGVAAGAAAGGAAGVAGSGVLSAPPPPGIGGIGNVPGPQTMGQAAAGVVLPGLVIILVNTLAGIPVSGGGSAPVPLPEVPPVDDAQADWLKQREEDLRQVREQKSFIAATAAGAQQGGFNTAEHERQLADLTRREKELADAIASGGGDTSYVAKVRDVVQVGAGFVEANRIAAEYARQQAIAAARIKMEQLEKARTQTAQDYWKDVRDGFWQNTVKDVDAIPGQLADAARSGLHTIGQVVHDTGKALTDPRNWHDAVKATMDTVRDIIAHPIDSAGKVGDFYGKVGGAAVKAAHHVVTHPVETIKSVLGADNWEKAFDPDVPVTERMARAAMGVIDAAATLTGLKQGAQAAKAAAGALEAAATKLGAAEAGAAVKTAAKKAAGRPDWIENKFSSELMAKSRASARLEQIGGAVKKPNYKMVDAPGAAIKGSDGKIAGSADGLAGGVTEQARRHAQVVADKHGVIIDVRPTNAASHDLIQQGKAVPKAPHCKSKTITEVDQYLGARKADIGLAGYFKPKKPDKQFLESLSPDMREAVKKRYQERLEEFADQAEHIAELEKKGACTVQNGVVVDGPSGKPYTGDHDIFDVRDARTGRPIPRYEIAPDGQIILNPDGTPKLHPVRAQVINELKKPPFNAQHGAHMDWKYDHLSHDIPEGAPAGTKSEFAVAQGIDQAVLNKHKQGGQPLVSYGADQTDPTGSYFEGLRQP